MSRVRELSFRDRVPVGILGATGAVGQQLVALLADHPWFRVEMVAASENSVGKTYGEAVHWLLSTPIPEEISKLKVQQCDPSTKCSLYFSALDHKTAFDTENEFANQGHAVVSNAQSHRGDPDVPLLVPEVNSKHLSMIEVQKKSRKGFIVTNPNCSVIGITLAIKPLYDLFGIEDMEAVTLQAISGSGHPGTPSLDIMDNIIPYIPGEEEKIETEPLKILGTCYQDHIENARIKISAQANRVPVTDGHLACLSIKLKEKPSKEKIIAAWNEFTGEAQILDLPSAPVKPLQYFDEKSYPQPKLHRNLNRGMTVCIGRLRECPVLDYKFIVLSHNRIRGAAGGAILNAELLVKHGYIFW